MHQLVIKKNKINKEIHLITKYLLIFPNFQLNQTRVQFIQV